jgi:hypothetical protein
VIERLGTVAEAQALAAALRERGFPEPAVLHDTSPLAVRVGPPLALPGAVALADRLRAAGHIARVAARPGDDPVAVVIRHGNFASRQEAEDRAGELARLGRASRVVRVR